MSYPYIPLEIDMEIDDNCENVPLDIGEAFFVYENDYNKLENKPSINGEELVGDIEITDLFDIDAEPTEGSENAVSSGGVYDALQGKQDSLTIDTQPVEDSGNPISSGGVYDALQGKQDTLTIDAAPTLDSTNPVQSGGTASALALKAPLNSPDLTGTPTAPTPTSGDNSTRIATTAFVEGEIARTVSGVYRPAGSVTFAQLPALTAAHVGEVYDITDAFTTTADFVEGAGISYPAGTDVAIVEPSEGVYKYDAMSGMVDLSNYYTDAEVDTLLAGKENALTFDNVPQENSQNPVTSDGIWAALQAKQDTLTIDAQPTLDSTNPVQSGGVAAALADKQDSLPSTSAADNGKVLGVSGGIYALIAQSVAAPDVYWATYGTTTYAQLTAAIAADQLPVCIYDELLFVCYAVSDEAVSFVAVSGEAVNSVYVDNADSWEYETIYLQRSLTIDATPTLDSTNPVQSGGTASALALKAPLASPALTGEPTAPTQTAGNNSTRIATTAFVQTAISGKQDALPVPTAVDNGKFLRVVNGAYALATVPEAAGEEF